MKLLIITDAWHPQINGVVRTYEHLIEALQKMGHDIHVISPADFRFTIPTPGYAEIRLALTPYAHLKTMIEKQAPETIHIATEGPLGWAARKYCIKNNLEFSTCYHSHFPDYMAKRLAKFLPFLYDPVHAITKKAVRNFHAPAHTMMIATQSLEDELKSWSFKTPMHRLTRGVNLDLFYPGEKTLFADLPRPVALYVGRVAIEKSVQDFLQMEWHGSKVVVGSGPSLARFSKQYTDVHFTGAKQGIELAAHFRSADVFVFPSRTDTFGMVQVEALASGIPVAAYNVRGPKDIITEDFLGILHEDNLSIAAKKALETGSPDQRAAHAKAHYNWEEAARQFAETMKPAKKS